MNKYSGKKVVRVYGDRDKGFNFSLANFVKNFSLIKSDFEVSAVCGHVNYKTFHDYFSEDIEQFRFFTFLRDPVERGISNINYMKANVNHRSHEKAKNITKENLYDFLSKSVHCNYQFSYLGGNCGFNVEEIMNNVMVFKLEDYKHALLKLGVIDEKQEVEKKNSTSGLKRKNGLETLSLLSVSDLSEHELSSLKELNSKDYKMISSAR